VENLKKAKLALALDVRGENEAIRLVERLHDLVDVYKIGPRLFLRAGGEFIRNLVERGEEVFLDLKFHDIPNTVADAVEAASKMGVSYLTLHASGGLAMLEAAVRARRKAGRDLKLLAVTVLTSIDETQLKEEMGVARELEEHVLHLVSLAHRAGIDGVVASVGECRMIKERFGEDFFVATPGIRIGKVEDDQKRVATAKEAICAGADMIVVGRPILQAQDPRAAAEMMVRQMEG